MPIKKTIGRIAAFSLRTIPYTFINLIAQHGRYYGTYGTVTNSCISTFFHFGVRGALVAPFTPGANPGCDDPDVNEKLTLLVYLIYIYISIREDLGRMIIFY